MTEAEVKEIVGSVSDQDEHTDEELAEMFAAIYSREPDEQDREAGLWSLICAGVAEPERKKVALAEFTTQDGGAHQIGTRRVSELTGVHREVAEEAIRTGEARREVEPGLFLVATRVDE